jgi:hypothetical protein
MTMPLHKQDTRPTGLELARINGNDRTRVRDLIQANRPFIAAGVASADRIQNWRFAALESRIGSRFCRVAVSATDRHEYDARKGLRVERMTFSDFGARAFGAPKRPGQNMYLQDDVRSFPELLGDTALPNSLQVKPVTQSKLMVSASASITSLHYDPVETYLEQIEGTKRLLLFPPGVANYYPHGWTTKAPFVSRVVNASDPDLAKYPRFGAAPRHEGLLHAGDVVYIPLGWWHEVHSLDPVNVSVNHRWFASVGKTMRCLPQFARSAPIVLKFLVSRAKQRVDRTLTAGAAGPVIKPKVPT